MNSLPSDRLASRHSPADLTRVLSIEAAHPAFPPATDRVAWLLVRQRLSEPRLSKLIAAAEKAAATPVPPLPASAFLDYRRTGQRERYNQPREQRREMLAALVLAECLEGGGRFLDPVLDLVWAICEESTWATSAHQIELTDLQRPVIDIHAAMTALELAETDALLGAQLDAALGKRVRDELDRRCFSPYLRRDDFKWLHSHAERRANNWTAVCTAGVLGAALLVGTDKQQLALMTARALRSLDDYLAGFDADGGSSEGPGYWDFGFGYYVVLAHLLDHHSGGQIDLLQGRRIDAIARFPLRTRLSPRHQLNFSDCREKNDYTAALLAQLAKRLRIPALGALANERPARARRANLSWGLRALFWPVPPDSPASCVCAAHDWFAGLMWMIARQDPSDPDALVLAAKGGHNGELHNHNDVGCFIVHVRGESLIADLGRGRYTQQYFGAQRYEHLATSSLGHSVPVVNGYAQQPGDTHGAVLLGHETNSQTDELRLELKDAYPAAAGLRALRRRIALLRSVPGGLVEVEDQVCFAEAPGGFESVLITFGQVAQCTGQVFIVGEQGGLRIEYAASLLRVTVDTRSEVDLPKGPAEVRRIVFALREPTGEARIVLRLVPIDRSACAPTTSALSSPPS